MSVREEAAAACGLRERPRAVEPRAVPLELHELGRRLRALTEPHHRLDRVRQDREDARVAVAHRRDLRPQRAQQRVRCGDVPDRELEEPEPAPVLEREGPIVDPFRDRQPFTSGGARCLDVPAVGPRERLHIQAAPLGCSYPICSALASPSSADSDARS